MLSFRDLSIANSVRDRDAFPTCGDWTESDWATAIAGEVGEACNFIKKRRRGDDAIPVETVADEFADAVIYIDLLCHRMGTTLEAAILRKFNVVSERVGSDVILRSVEHC